MKVFKQYCLRRYECGRDGDVFSEIPSKIIH